MTPAERLGRLAEDHADEWIGPILFVDDVRDDRLRLSALVFTARQDDPDPLVCGGETAPFIEIASESGWRVLRARFSGGVSERITYEALGQSHALAGGFDGDLNIAFASCNGEENGDLDRDPAERNVMWARLRDQNEQEPFHLMLHGGDQIYADEVVRGHPLSDEWPDEIPKDPSRADLETLRNYLRQGFFERYLRFYIDCTEARALSATVPSLCQWDDHDICDGWGSLRRSRTYSPVGQVLFDCALEVALIFQHACTADDVPGRFHDPLGRMLGWWVDFPRLRLVAPDLRSERTRRQIMGPSGWQMMDAVAAVPTGTHVMMVSSVPLLGPRLSVIEALMILIPKMQEYEDDLRDQWQSRAHREEWRRMLRLLVRIAGETGAGVTVVSGEIHLAARATMPLGSNARLHQLIASGVTHRPPPKIWARILGWLASFGDAPLDGAPIRIERIPGQARRYIADRNTLTLQRRCGEWEAVWDIEEIGRTLPLALD